MTDFSHIRAEPRLAAALASFPLAEVRLAGHTGRGVRVGLADTGVGRGVPGRVEGDSGPLHGHGTLMAYLIHKVAPEATVVSAVANRDPTQAVQRVVQAGCDLVLCAWSVDHRPSLRTLLGTLSTPIVAPKIANPTALPGSFPGVISVEPDTHGWPTGPVEQPFGPPACGLSVAHALLAGALALWLGKHRGQPITSDILFSETLFRQLGTAQ